MGPQRNPTSISTPQVADPCGIPKWQDEELQLAALAGTLHSSGMGSDQPEQRSVAQDGTDTFSHYNILNITIRMWHFKRWLFFPP